MRDVAEQQAAIKLLWHFICLLPVGMPAHDTPDLRRL
jgi:hypothetical protein